MMSSKFLAANSRATYMRYIRARKDIMMNQGVLSFLKELGKVAGASKTLCIMHLDNPSLYISFEEDVRFVVMYVDAFVKNDHKPTCFHQNVFS